MTRFPRLLAVAVALVGLGAPADAQDLTGRMETFHVRDARVSQIVAHPDGLLMGTSTGVVHLDRDGRVVRVEDPSDSGLGGLRVEHLVEGPDGELWASDWGWLARSDGPGRPWALVDLEGTPLDDGLWREDDNGGEPAHQLARRLVVGPDGALWAGTYHGVARYHEGRWTTFDDAPASPGVREIKALGVDLRGRVYAVYNRVQGSSRTTWLSVLDGDTWTAFEIDPRGGFVGEIVASPEGHAWVVRYLGLFEVYDGAAYLGAIAPPPGGAYHVAFLETGLPFTAGPSGVYVAVEGGWGTVTDEVRGGHVATVGDEVWAIGVVPSLETGGTRVSPRDRTSFEIEMTPTLYSERATAVAARGDAVWAAGEHGLYRYDRGAWADVPLPDGTWVGPHLIDLDRTGGVWLSLRGDLWRYAEEGWTDLGLPVRSAYRLSASPDGAEVWVAAQNSVAEASGLQHRAADGTWTRYTSRDVPMPNDRISDVEAVGPGEAWYSIGRHLVHLRDGVATDYGEALGLTTFVGPMLTAGPDGTLYAAVHGDDAYEGDALLWFDGDEWHREEAFGFEMRGLHTIRITAVSVDPEGRPWVLTDWGLSVLADGVWRPLPLRGLGVASPAWLAAEAPGVVWIGDSGGVHRFTPEGLPTASGPSPGVPGGLVSAPYPNPTAGRVTLDVGAAGSLTVVDLLGRVVAREAWGRPGTVSLDLTDLPAGLYLVRVSADGGGAVRRVIKR